MRTLLRANQNILILGLLSFFNDYTADMMLPLLPAYVASMGLGATFIGIMEGLSSSLSYMTMLFSGWLADQTHQNVRLTRLGYGLCAIIRPFYFFATPPVTLAVRMTDRIGKGLRTAPRDQLLTSNLEKNNWGKAFGFQRGLDHAGTLAGSATALAIIYFFPLIHLPKLFFFASLPALLAYLILAPQIKRAKPSSDDLIKRKQSIFKLTKPSWNKLSPSFRFYLFLIFLSGLSTPSDLFLILRLNQLGMKTAHNPLVLMAIIFMTLSFSYLGGKLSDSWGRRKCLGLGWILFAASFAGLAFSPSLAVGWASVMVYGIHTALIEASERAYAAGLSSPETQATHLGWYYFALGLGYLPASIIFGFFWDFIGSQTVFLIYAFMTLIPVAGLFFLPSDRTNKTLVF